MLMLIELTFLIPIGGQWSGLEEHLDFCILCVCTRVCVCTCTLPLPGHAQALSSPWTWVQGHAAAAFPLLGRPVLKTKQSLPSALQFPGEAETQRAGMCRHFRPDEVSLTPAPQLMALSQER